VYKVVFSSVSKFDHGDVHIPWSSQLDRSHPVVGEIIARREYQHTRRRRRKPERKASLVRSDGLGGHKKRAMSAAAALPTQRSVSCLLRYAL